MQSYCIVTRLQLQLSIFLFVTAKRSIKIKHKLQNQHVATLQLKIIIKKMKKKLQELLIK